MTSKFDSLADCKITDVPVLTAEKIWRGKVFDLREDLVQLPMGGEPVVRQYLDHPGAVAVVALKDGKSGESGEILVLEQYRHPVQAKLWELPAGLLDVPGESYLDAARRELREETDLQADRWDVLVDLFTSPGASSESLRIFLARDLTRCAEEFERTEEEADMRTAWISIDRAVRLVMDGHLHNPTAIAGIFAVAEAQRSGWQSLRSVNCPWMR